MQDQHDLSLILDSRVPLVVVETHDEGRFLDFLTGGVTGSAAREYHSLSILMAERLQTLRDWASERTVPAD
jgi:hypothetical protein